MIEIFGKPSCPYCDAAKSLCVREGIQYTYKQLGEDFTREELLLLFPTAKTFPQIRSNGEIIGGFTDLEKWVFER